jgi:hypothetical protein
LRLDGKSVPRIALFLSLSALSLSLVQATLFRSKRIHAEGIIAVLSLQVYSDPDCTIVLNSVDWGRLKPGQSRNTTAYVRLAGNTPSTLGLSIDNFVPADASQFLTLTWNYAGGVISPGEILKVTFTLQVDSSITGIESFSFDIIVRATEAT